LAIVGEPNVGKSTLLNSFLREERAIVSEQPGTTRDSIEEILEYHNHFIRLIDTAGIRHKRKIREVSDLFSLSRSKKSIHEANITFLLFDARDGIKRDTKAIARILEEERKPALLVANKWDMVKGVEQAPYEIDLKELLGFLKYSPLVFISAKNKRNLEKLLDSGIDLWKRSTQHISTNHLNEFLSRMKRRRLPSPAIRLKFLTQTAAVPQEFVCFVKNKKLIPTNYHNHFENELITHFHLEGIPIRLHFKEVGESHG
jgi:GTP-binding protein